MKRLLTLLFVCFGFFAEAQSPWTPADSYGTRFKRTRSDSTDHIPTFCGVPTLRNSTATKNAALAFDSCNHRFYFYDPKTLAWDTIAGGGSSFDTTTIYNLLADKVDSIAQRNDSVFYYISGAEIFAWLNDTPCLIQNGVLSGGIVTWLHDYVYNISEAYYNIDCVTYHSLSTDITLDAAHATLDRIDLFALTTSNTAIDITGTAGSGIPPDYDANLQLQISFALVTANTTEPTGIVNEWIYRENTEWTTAVSAASINPNSTNNPYAGTKDVEGTNVANNSYIGLTAPVQPNMAFYNALVLQIRSKGNFANNKKLILRFLRSPSNAIGGNVIIGSGSYGFVSSMTASYQTITIPLIDFGDISTANALRITQSNTSGNQGWYIDDIQLQKATGNIQQGRFVDTIWRTQGKDSIQFTIGGRYGAIKDSSGMDTTTIYNTLNTKLNVSDTLLDGGPRWMPFGNKVDTVVQINDSTTRYYFFNGTTVDLINRFELTQENIQYITNIINYIDSIAGEDSTFILAHINLQNGLPVLYVTYDSLSTNDSLHTNFPRNNVAEDSVLTTDADGNLKMVLAGTGGGVQSVVAGANVTVDNTDPANPIVSSSGGGGGGIDSVRKKYASDTVYQYSGATPSFAFRAIPIYYAKDYGVKSDSSTNDTDSLNALIALASSRGGGRVVLPKGTTVVQSVYLSASAYKPKGIVLKSNVSLEGQGKGVTTILLDDEPATITSGNGVWWAVIRGDTVYNSSVRDLTVDGNQANNQAIYTQNPYDASVTFNNIFFRGGDSNSVYNVESKNSVGSGVFYTLSINGVVDNCDLNDNAFSGLVFADTSNNCTLRNSRVSRSFADNIRVTEGADYCSIINNESSYSHPILFGGQNVAGIYIQGSQGARVIGNYCHDNSSYGIDVANIYTIYNKYTMFAGATIANNTVSYNANAGIQLAMPHSLVSGNKIFNNARTSFGIPDSASSYHQAGINIAAGSGGLPEGGSGGASGSTIIGNDIRETRSNGMLYGFDNSSGADTAISFIGNNVSGVLSIFSTGQPNVASTTNFGNSLFSASRVYTSGNYVNTLLTGLGGSQTVIGATNTGGDLYLTSTAHASKDRIFLGLGGLSQFDEGSDRLGIGISPLTKLHVSSATSLDGITIEGTTIPSLTFKTSGAVTGRMTSVTTANQYISGTVAGDMILNFPRVIAIDKFAVDSTLGVGTIAPVASAKVEILSTTKGFLKPRMTTTQRDAITSPATGLEIYNTTTSLPNFYDGAAWQSATGYTFSTGLVNTASTITNNVVTGLAGSQTWNGGTAANEDVTINGTTHATKASSYVILQPTGGLVGIGTTTPIDKLEIQDGYYAGYHANAGDGAGYGFNAYTLTTGAAKATIGNFGVFQQGANTRAGAFEVFLSNGSTPAGIFSIAKNGAVHIGARTTATAMLHLPAGTATASTAPIKFVAGTQLTTPESGVLETIVGNQLKYSTSTTANSRGFVELGRIISTASGLTADATHNTIVLSATGQTITLPTAVGIQGRIYTIKISASGSATVATTSSETIDGSTTYSLSAQYKYVTVQSDNVNWMIIANN